MGEDIQVWRLLGFVLCQLLKFSGPPPFFHTASVVSYPDPTQSHVNWMGSGYKTTASDKKLGRAGKHSYKHSYISNIPNNDFITKFIYKRDDHKL